MHFDVSRGTALPCLIAVVFLTSELVDNPTLMTGAESRLIPILRGLSLAGKSRVCQITVSPGQAKSCQRCESAVTRNANCFEPVSE